MGNLLRVSTPNTEWVLTFVTYFFDIKMVVYFFLQYAKVLNILTDKLIFNHSYI